MRLHPHAEVVRGGQDKTSRREQTWWKRTSKVRGRIFRLIILQQQIAGHRGLPRGSGQHTMGILCVTLIRGHRPKGHHPEGGDGSCQSEARRAAMGGTGVQQGGMALSLDEDVQGEHETLAK